MCGIVGLWAPRVPAEERRRVLRRMLACLRHRGPDGTAIWDGPELSLGLTRLAIVEPTAPAHVPRCERGDVHAVVNGEIYNHHVLRRELSARGHRFVSRLDTEVVPHLYQERGPGFVTELDGMFAAAVWDGPARRLTLARDRAGEKPLFLARGPHRVAFASEPAALLELPWVSRDPAPESIARYLAHGYFAGEDCAFADIRQLAPAHTLTLGEDGVHATRYWRPWDALDVGAPPPANAPAATRAALARSVESRVPADVPFGVFLSGGIDSGAVAALVARSARHRIPTFTLRMAHRGYDESAPARAVAELIGSEHHELTMDAASGIEAIERVTAMLDQPLGDPSILPTWLLARLAADHVPVVLTGEGGDELFAGYPTYLGHRYARWADALPAPIAFASRELARRLRPRHHHVTIAHMVERYLDARGMRPFDRHLAWFGAAGSTEARALLSPALRADVAAGAASAHLRRVERDLGGAVRLGTSPSLVAYQLLDFETYLPGDLLTKVDRATMAHGLESRAPFLHHPLVEHAMALPDRARLRGVTGKWSLREAVRPLLPPELFRQRKRGFSPPFSAWARGPLSALVESRLSEPRVRRAGVLDPAAVRSLLESHRSGRVDRGRALWCVLSLQAWAERWVVASAAVTHGDAVDADVAVAATE